MKMIIEVGPLTRNEIDSVLFQIDEGCSSLQLTEDEAKWATTLIESARDAHDLVAVNTDLLAALKAYVSTVLTAEDPLTCPVEHNGWSLPEADFHRWKAARAAIAKAEGRT